MAYSQTLDMVAGSGQYGFDPLGSFIEGREARNRLNQLKFAEKARPLMGAALQGDESALRGLAGVDPNAFMKISEFQQKDPAAEAEKIARLVEWGDSPEKWGQVTERIQRMGHQLEPQELDFNGREAMLAEYRQASKGEGFTLGEGQVRYGPNGEQIAAGPPKTGGGFTLPAGGIRYNPDGTPLAAAPSKPVQPRALTSVDKNAILEADDQVQAGTNVIDMLNRALAINEKAGSGALAGMQAFLARNDPTGFFDDERGAATTEFNNIVLNQALSSMKSIFGGNPTEGERAVLVQLQGAADKSPVERKAIIERGIELAKRRVAFNKERAEEIRGGSYFGGASTVQPSGQQQGQAEPGNNQFDNVDDIPEGATFVDDDTGQAYRKENGQVIPVE
jgi:hypothetical protein